MDAMTLEDDPLYRQVKERARKRTSTDEVIDAELLASFEQIVTQMHGERKFSDKELLDQVDRVKEVLLSVSGHSPTDSRIPGGALVHRLIQRLTARQVRGLAQQVQGLFVVQQQLIETLVERSVIAEQRETRLIGLLSQHVIDRLVLLESLERRLSVLEQRGTPEHE